MGTGEKLQARREPGNGHVLLALALIALPAVSSAEPLLVAAAGAAVQLDAPDPEVATAVEAGLALDVGERLRLAVTGAYLPEVSRADDVVNRGLWRIGPTLRWSFSGPSREGGPWVALGTGMGATTEAARPFARADLGWSLGRSAQLGAVLTAVRELDRRDGGTLVALLVRFDGLLPGPWVAPPARVAADPPRPPPRPEPPLPGGAPLDPETVRTRVRDNGDDIETCLALAARRGEPTPPRVDLALVILPAGRVHAAHVFGAGDELGRCVASRARAWTFPPTEGTTRFRAPFVLR